MTFRTLTRNVSVDIEVTFTHTRFDLEIISRQKHLTPPTFLLTNKKTRIFESEYLKICLVQDFYFLSVSQVKPMDQVARKKLIGHRWFEKVVAC